MFNPTLPPPPKKKKIPGKKTEDKRTTKTAYCKIHNKDPQQEESMPAA